MSWNEVKSQINKLSERDLLTVIQELYKLNKDNQRYLNSRFVVQNRHDVIQDIKDRLQKFTLQHEKQRECRKLINDYKKATSDLIGYIELCAWHAYLVADFISQFGGCEESFENGGVTSFEYACRTYLELSDNQKLLCYKFISDSLEHSRDLGCLYDMYNDYFVDIRELEA